MKSVDLDHDRILVAGTVCGPGHLAGNAGVGEISSGKDRLDKIRHVGCGHGDIIDACLLHCGIKDHDRIIAVCCELVGCLAVLSGISSDKLCDGFVGAVDIERRDVLDGCCDGGAFDLTCDAVQTVGAENRNIIIDKSVWP